jgi:short-subunit dehydrogenase
MKISGKTFVVTGAGNGIGRALTLHLLDQGARVAAVDLNEEFLNETKELAGKKSENISLHVLNISDKEAVDNLPDQVEKAHHHIDAIINNAGIIQPFVKIEDLEMEDIDRVMNVNFYGTLYMIKAFLPFLKERPQAHIANVSSMGGFLPVPGQSIYGASKAAVKLMTEALYAELRNTNVGVSIIFPGATETNISENSGIKMDSDNTETSGIKMNSASKAAEHIIKGIEKNKFRILLGSDSKTMDFLYRVSPKYATNLIAKKMASLLKD